jgi:hypothetical protein
VSVGDSIRKNLYFWHWYPRLLCEGMSDADLHWQPDAHPNHITFALWHAYRSEDEIIHGILMQKPSLFAREGWSSRLSVAEPGNPPFGTGLTRRQIAAIHLPLTDVLEYAEVVGAAIQAYADTLSEEEGRQEIPLPFFAEVYPMLDSASKAEVLNFFCIGHTAEHLGEVQYIKGLLGLTGAPL